MIFHCKGCGKNKTINPRRSASTITGTCDHCKSSIGRKKKISLFSLVQLEQRSPSPVLGVVPVVVPLLPSGHFIEYVPLSEVRTRRSGK